MQNSTPCSFNLCNELTLRLLDLRFDAAAEPRPCILPLASIFWLDEWPNAEPHVRCHGECNDSLLRLVAARAEFWRSEIIPAEAQSLWNQAKELIPDWPGFQRMYISEEQRRVIEKCENEAEEFFKVMSEEMDTVAVTEKNGIVKWSASMKLD